MTDWEKQLKQRRAAIRRAEQALEETIADAHDQGGLSWRKIGTAAEVNHEWARQAAARVAERRAAAGTDLPAEPVANPRRTKAAEPDAGGLTVPGEHSPDLTRLTHREHMIIGMLADGMTLAEIASMLGIQQEWVARQQRNARRKLGVTTEPQWQAVLRASRDEA